MNQISYKRWLEHSGGITAWSHFRTKDNGCYSETHSCVPINRQTVEDTSYIGNRESRSAIRAQQKHIVKELELTMNKGYVAVGYNGA